VDKRVVPLSVVEEEEEVLEQWVATQQQIQIAQEDHQQADSFNVVAWVAMVFKITTEIHPWYFMVEVGRGEQIQTWIIAHLHLLVDKEVEV